MKNYNDLMDDVFNFFKEKYCSKKEENMFLISKKTEILACELNMNGGFWNNFPYLFLLSNSDGSKTIKLCLLHCDVIRTELLTRKLTDSTIIDLVAIDSKFKNLNIVYTNISGSVGGISGLIELRDCDNISKSNDEKNIKVFRFELLMKIQELLLSGEYYVERESKE